MPPKTPNSTRHTMAELSADELALYDRQLRVWGAEGQNRIKAASILMINLNGVGTEIVKNLVLAGVGSLEIQDSCVLKEEDLSCQFFSTEDDIGELKLKAAETRIRDLNNRVSLSINTEPLDLRDVQYFKQFNLVIANNLAGPDLVELNEITRQLSITLHSTTTHGLYGYIFNDLLLDVTAYTRTKMPIARKVGPISANKEITSVEILVNQDDKQIYEKFTVKSTFKRFTQLRDTMSLRNQTKRQRKNLSPFLSTFLSLARLQIAGLEINAASLKQESEKLITQWGINDVDDQIYEELIQQLDTEISPVVAILGGALAQDVINFLSKKEQPINNFLILDGHTFAMPIYEL